MQPRVCAGCGAPLPDTETSGPITCRFCGLVHDHASLPRVAPAGVRRSPQAEATAVRTVVITSVVLALAAALLGILLAFVVLPGLREPPVTRSAAPVRRPEPPRALRVADLATASDGLHAIDVAPPPGGYGAIDPVAQVPWALAIAQGWAEDARLERVDVMRLRPDGTINVADDPDGALAYRFVSPQRASDLAARALTSARAEAVTELHLRIVKGRPAVILSAARAGARRPGGGPPPHPRVLSLTTLVPRLRADARYDLPYLSGYLIHLEREGWVWYLSPISGESLPRVRATDGATWPYRGRRR